MASPSIPPRPVIEVRPSARRTRTAAACFEGDRIVVTVPAAMPAAERAQVAERLADRLIAKAAAAAHKADADLSARAAELSARYLDGKARPASIRWVDNQRTRWGSCTPATRTIRINSALRHVPDWVLDSVIVHELAHLLAADHGPRFKALVARYPRTGEASTWLAGYGWGLAAAPQPAKAPARRPARKKPAPAKPAAARTTGRRPGSR